MHALPPAPAPAPRRQLLVGTALACAASAALMGGMLALWMRFRAQAIDGAASGWLPKGVFVPEVATNTMLISLIPLCIFAQWAVYSAKRGDRPHTGLALGLTGLVALMFINAQAYVWSQMHVAAASEYGAMFYTVTGVLVALAIAGVVFSAVTAFRYLGGRTADRDIVASHALYWYSFSAVFAVLWLVVYVTK